MLLALFDKYLVIFLTNVLSLYYFGTSYLNSRLKQLKDSLRATLVKVGTSQRTSRRMLPFGQVP